MDRRTQILKAAFSQMAEHGLEAVHARTVADRLGINHATVHYYFKSRLDLLLGIAEHAQAQLALDRQSLGEPENGREAVENEIALIESYSRPSSKMGTVLLSLCAACKNEPQLAPAAASLAKAFFDPIQAACRDAKQRKSSPFAEGLLIGELLLGTMMKGHLTGDSSETEQILDEVHALLFKS